MTKFASLIVAGLLFSSVSYAALPAEEVSSSNPVSSVTEERPVVREIARRRHRRHRRHHHRRACYRRHRHFHRG